MFAYLLLAAFTINPPEIILIDRFDIVELNHKLERPGRENFQQLIFYKWSDTKNRYKTEAWRMIKDESLLPQFSHDTKTFVYRCMDGTDIREVHSKHMIETWTYDDPEVLDRKDFPVEFRSDLTKRRGKPPLNPLLMR